MKAREGSRPWLSGCDVLNYLSSEDLLNSCSLSTIHTQGYEPESAELAASELSGTTIYIILNQHK